jgi:hypothetical protein
MSLASACLITKKNVLKMSSIQGDGRAIVDVVKLRSGETALTRRQMKTVEDASIFGAKGVTM